MTTVDQTPGWTWRGLARAAAISGVAFGTGAALGYGVSHERPPQTPGGSTTAPTTAPNTAPNTAMTGAVAPHASDAELAILSPLREGGTLGEFLVAEIRPVGGDGTLQIVCRREGATVRLDVALAADGGPSPPAVAGPYAVFYALENAAPADGQRLALALALILKTNAFVPPPPGLEPFKAGNP